MSLSNPLSLADVVPLSGRGDVGIQRAGVATKKTQDVLGGIARSSRLRLVCWPERVDTVWGAATAVATERQRLATLQGLRLDYVPAFRAA